MQSNQPLILFKISKIQGNLGNLILNLNQVQLLTSNQMHKHKVFIHNQHKLISHLHNILQITHQIPLKTQFPQDKDYLKTINPNLNTKIHSITTHKKDRQDKQNIHFQMETDIVEQSLINIQKEVEFMISLNKIYNIEVILKQVNNMEKAHFSENLLDIHRDKM